MEKQYTITEAARFLERSVKTLQKWDRRGILPARRTGTNRRIYTESQLLEFLGLEGPTSPSCERAIVAYCRVSSQAQKPDLRNQRRMLEKFCIARGLANVEFVEEIGGGLNFNRKKFLKLMDRIVAEEVGSLILAHRDRLARFGFDFMAHLCEAHGCELLIVNAETLSPEAELVQDFMTIVHCFSSRLDGLRNYRKALKEALKSDADGSSHPDVSHS